MPADDSLISQGTIDFRDEGRRAANAGPQDKQTRKPVVCERCRKGPHHDGFPPIYTASEAIDLGWSRTQTGLLDEECAGEIASYEDNWREGL